MSFPAYDEYQDSGVEWLKEIPRNWQAVPIKHVGRLKGGAGFPHDDQGVEGEILDFHKVNALSRADAHGYLVPSDNTISPDTANRLGAFVFPPETIVFAKVGAALLLARIRIIRNDSCIDNNMMGLIVHQDSFDVSFVRYAMELVRFDLIANPGAVPSLNEGQIGNFRLPTPADKDEQKAISSFLDVETSKIDGLVSEQRRLIELLKEKRQAVISHAVTKGLNPNAPMKPSGIQWLGDVPQHWSVVALKYLASLKSGDGITGDSIEETGDYPVFGGNGLRGFTDAFTHDGHYVIIGRQGALCGNVNYGQGKFWASEHAVVATPTRSLDTVWLGEMIRSMNLNQYSETAAQPGLSMVAVGNLRTVLPPIEEQQEIAKFVTKTTTEFDSLSAEAERAIELLQERRTALISAAVTGKIDVRKFAHQETP